jgi:homocysteine S-methyltransferase
VSSPSHASYIAAGAELIETNTFGANRRKLARVLLDDSFEQINSTAVRLAREAREVAGRDVFVAGSIGPARRARGVRCGRARPGVRAQAQALEDAASTCSWSRPSSTSRSSSSRSRRYAASPRFPSSRC